MSEKNASQSLRALWRKFFISVACLAVVGALSQLPPTWVEWGYSRGLYPVLWRSVRAVFSFLPVPGLYVLLGLLLVAAAMYVRRVWRKPARWKRLWLAGASVLMWAVILFQLLWGLNYRRVPVARQLGLQAVAPDTALLRALALEAADSLNVWAGRLSREGGRPLPSVGVGLAVQADLCAALEEEGYPCLPAARLRWLRPEGVLLRLGTAGFYLPYSGEGHLDAGLHPLQQPFVMAHELAHAQGFGDEGVCNFWAWRATVAASDPFVVYAAWLAWWSYLSAEMRRFSPETTEQWKAHLSPQVRADMAAIDERMARYPDLFPALRNWIYHHYLVAQGVEEGLASYGQLVSLVIAWRQSRGDTLMPLPQVSE